jgi:hypothetical protein
MIKIIISFLYYAIRTQLLLVIIDSNIISGKILINKEMFWLECPERSNTSHSNMKNR